MFDIREIKSIPSYKEFGRTFRKGNYDPCAPKIAALNFWSGCIYGGQLIKFYVNERKHTPSCFDPLSFNNRVVNGRDLIKWKSGKEVCNER